MRRAAGGSGGGGIGRREAEVSSAAAPDAEQGHLAEVGRQREVQRLRQFGSRGVGVGGRLDPRDLDAQAEQQGGGRLDLGEDRRDQGEEVHDDGTAGGSPQRAHGGLLRL